MSDRLNGDSYVVARVGAETGLADRWRAVVADHDRATPFHTLAWRRVIKRTFDYEPAHRLVLDADTDKPIAAVPGFETPETLGATYKNPFCEYGYPLLAEGVQSDGDAVGVLDAIAADSRDGVAVVVKECPVSSITGYYEAEYGGIETGVTHRVSTDLAFGRLRGDVVDKSLRRRARLAREEGLVVRPSADLDAYYERYRETMERLGSPQFPQDFFRALRSAFGESFHYHVVEADGRVVAGLISLSCGDSWHLLSNASERRPNAVSPNPLLYLSMLESACEGDTDVVDFGRTEPESGVDRFKSLFNGSVHPLVSFVAPPRKAKVASVSGYKRLAPLTRLVSPLITHPAVGPRLKRRIHE